MGRLTPTHSDKAAAAAAAAAAATAQRTTISIDAM